MTTSIGQNECFVEVQRFRQPWLWALLFATTTPVVGVFVWGLYVQLVLGQAWGDRPMSDTGLILVSCAAIGGATGVVALLWFARLSVLVDSRGLHVQYVPFQWSVKQIPLNEVMSVEAKTYSPLRDYGGWGIRYRLGGKVYNASGNRGVLLTFANGKTLLVGSQRPDALAATIHHVWAGGKS